MSPRIDHRPPVIAFLVLVVLAVAIVSTNARAVESVVLVGKPLEVHARVTGTILDVERVAAAPDRVQPVSRQATRPSLVRPAVGHATLSPARGRHVAAQGHRRGPQHRLRVGFSSP